MSDTKKGSRAFMIINCIALGIIAMNLTAPVHEATHLITQMPDFCLIYCLLPRRISFNQ